MERKITLIVSCILLLMIIPLGNIYAATYYMPDDFANLQVAFSGMSGGDTLIIRNGTYTGISNVLDYTHKPPSGTSGAYTKIIAENTGGVIFDGEGVRNMFAMSGSSPSSGPHHIQFEGIQWKNTSTTSISVSYCDYIKFIKCSCSEVNGTGQSGGNGFSVSYSTYILFEDCWSWGAARKHFYIANSAEKVIVRRCVARHDRFTDYADQECFMAYDSWDVEFQNCIAIDGDQGSYYTPVSSTTAKAYCVRDTTGNTEGIYFRGCISLNNQNMLGWTGSNQCDFYLIDCVHWDSETGNRIRLAGSDFDHCTFGNVSGTGTWSPLAYLEGGDTITNSLLYDAYYGIWGASSLSNYNCLFNINDNYSGTNPGTNDICSENSNAIDPVDASPGNGMVALKYLVRVENGSDLDGAASDGDDIGATVVKKIGVSGTLWGEPGYNTETSDDLWPFPNEDIIRQNMREYSYDGGNLSGNRGFCVDGQTLTKYIWEYLGHAMPSDIYGPDTTSPATISNLSAATGVNNGEVDLTWTAPGDDGSSGTVNSYDGRYSTASINDSNWASATQASGEPGPSSAGSSETMTISGLTPGQTYYFAIKSQDEVPNVSALSNVVSVQAKMPIPDTTPPYTDGHSPAKNATNIMPDTPIIVHVKDDGAGVDINTIVMRVNGQVVSPTITGTPADYTLTYNPPSDFDYGDMVNIEVQASDLAP